jgi:hypothetical protein
MINSFWKNPKKQISSFLSTYKERARLGKLKKAAKTIEKTLDRSDIKAIVTENNNYPTGPYPNSWQFALEVKPKTNMSKMRLMSKDLAKALGIKDSEMGLELPIPGRTLAGINIPKPYFESKINRNRIGLIILIIVFILLSLNNNFNSATSTKTKVASTPNYSNSPNASPGIRDLSSPYWLVRNYYSWYFTCAAIKVNASTIPSYCKNDRNEAFSTDLKSTLKKAQGSDPILCSQNVPQGVSFDKEIISGEHSSVMVHEQWEQTADTSIQVGLDRLNGKWVISSIKCPSPIPTPTPCATEEGIVNQILYGSCISPTPKPTPFPTGLTLINQTMTGNSYSDPNPVFSAELHNYDYSNNYKNVVVRFSFYKQNSGSCLLPADDNEYVKISNYIAKGDTQTIKTDVVTNFDTSGAFNWCASIYSKQAD